MSEWISVKDRLPENGQFVLTVETYGERFIFQVKQRFFVNISERTGKKRKYPFGAVSTKVHYWLPIPNYEYLEKDDEYFGGGKFD